MCCAVACHVLMAAWHARRRLIWRSLHRIVTRPLASLTRSVKGSKRSEPCNLIANTFTHSYLPCHPRCFLIVRCVTSGASATPQYHNIPIGAHGFMARAQTLAGMVGASALSPCDRVIMLVALVCAFAQARRLRAGC